jgi:sirohydrochlorin ferrochelatase
MPDQTEGQTAVLLIAHGSRHAAANDDLHRLAARFAEAGRYPVVEPSFLELAEPDIQAGGDRCVAKGATRVLMVPYFLSAGVHLLRDLTAAREALGLRHPGVAFRLGQALGPDPLLDRLVEERIGQLDADDGDAPGSAPSAATAVRYAPLEGGSSAPDTSASSAPPSSIDTNRAKE